MTDLEKAALKYQNDLRICKEYRKRYNKGEYALITVDLKNKTVKASTKNAALQLRNESVIEEDFPKVNITYPIKGSYGLWSILNLFNTTKGGELILLTYINY